MPDRDPSEEIGRAADAARKAMRLAVDAVDRSAGAHEELARVQGEAARLESAAGSPERAADRRRASRRALNEATDDHVDADGHRSRG